jgi:hypothetical protein
MSAKEKIEELALRVAQDALDPSATPEDRREALKILNPHYTMLLKSKVKDDLPAEGGFDFDRFNQENRDGRPDKITQMGGRLGGWGRTSS